jgi:hypothetical protein
VSAPELVTVTSVTKRALSRVQDSGHGTRGHTVVTSACERVTVTARDAQVQTPTRLYRRCPESRTQDLPGKEKLP